MSMPECRKELKKYFNHLMSLVEGLYAIIITDRDGVPVFKVSTENAPELALRPTFLSTFGMATDQASKLGLSKNKSMISTYSAFQVVHLNKLPLIVTMVASSKTNTGMLLALERDFDNVLKDMRAVVDIS
ncbi:ragulator complex protein LAMTOR3-A isoform X1 [Lingula anatina]|uniref:Ragulator complex protein LAMTOR3-A isoform X1 n=2 Tax=Lingula anatina TaxID=7574 RepID=A0A1S3J7L7_LINAN|nr:ragulator complex protein LAMTOR3-A isoform X1 [Lingula anatina]|eukprot:XP_013406226.1 ragulator complex protein LAMTOR3-A isoform X1 [Lingula anatina]